MIAEFLFTFHIDILHFVSCTYKICLLTGSHQLALHDALAQSLAGRTTILLCASRTGTVLNMSDIAKDVGVSHNTIRELRGRLYETMVVMELIKTRFNKGRDANIYFYRDSEKKEIDVLYKHGSLLSAIEIKSSQTLSSDFMKGIQYLKNIVGNRFSQAYVVYAGKDEMIYHDVNILNHLHSSQIINECDKN